MRILPAPIVLSIVLLLALTACVAPATNGSAPASETRVGNSAVTAPANNAPPASTPPSDAPPPMTPPVGPSDDGEYPRPKPPLGSRDPLPPAPGAVTLDHSCKVDADCAVKNVGNCCGYAPACVNKDSRTDPEGVKAQCAKQGMSSICGFPEIAGCSCVKGRCEAQSGGVTQ